MNIPEPKFDLCQKVRVIGTPNDDTRHDWQITKREWLDLEGIWDYTLQRIDRPIIWTVYCETNLAAAVGGQSIADLLKEIRHELTTLHGLYAIDRPIPDGFQLDTKSLTDKIDSVLSQDLGSSQ